MQVNAICLTFTSVGFFCHSWQFFISVVQHNIHNKLCDIFLFILAFILNRIVS